jgi:hypothetical protein
MIDPLPESNGEKVERPKTIYRVHDKLDPIEIVRSAITGK